MSVGTKTIMAAAGGGSSAGEVLQPILTLSDSSGSNKYYLSAVDTQGNIAWSQQVGTSLPSSAPYRSFPTSGRGDLTWFCEVGKVWWVMASSFGYVWGIDVETGDCSFYSIYDSTLPTLTSNQYGPSVALNAPTYFNSSGGTDTLGWVSIVNDALGTPAPNYIQGYQFTNNRTTTPTVHADFSFTNFGDSSLGNGNAMANYQYNTSSGFHGWKVPSTNNIIFAWAEGSANNSFNIKISSGAIKASSPSSLLSGPTSMFGPTSNYSRGTAVRIASGISMQKFFDENWVSYNGLYDAANVVGDSGDSMGVTGSNQGTQHRPQPTITSPKNFGTTLGPNVMGALTFDYEQACSVVSDGVKGMWGFIRTYTADYSSLVFNLGYVETGTSWSSGQSMSYASGGDLTDYSDIAYKATNQIYEFPASANYDPPNFSMRRINDNGYIGMWYPDFSISNARYKFRVLDATNGQVGSDIEFDFPANLSNKPCKWTTLREDAVWTKLYTGSDVS